MKLAALTSCVPPSPSLIVSYLQEHLSEKRPRVSPMRATKPLLSAVTGGRRRAKPLWTMVAAGDLLASCGCVGNGRLQIGNAGSVTLAQPMWGLGTPNSFPFFSLH
jgi:hypothetical protein